MKLNQNKPMVDEEIHELLGYPRLKIIQRNDALKFSLDSLLVASFVVTSKKVKRILDIGTGNGPIPLYLSLKTSAHITGVELQDISCDLAKRNVKLNSLDNQIYIECEDINEFKKKTKPSSFDVIVSNPPFYTMKDHAQYHQSDLKAMARHELTLTLDTLIESSKHLLKTGGSFVMIHRSERLNEIFHHLNLHGFYPKRIQFIHTKVGHKAKMVLIDSVFGSSPKMMVCPPLFIHDNFGNYTKEVLDIFNYGGTQND
jgi:tRNA1Val (adenine37-N6)-methyltransferase